MTSRMMLQAIVTKYLGPGNVRGARIKATAAAGSVTLSWGRHRLDRDANHEAAAMALATKYGWLDGWRLEGGGLPNGDCVWVLVREAAI